jgi:hypothetical protein
MLMDLTVCFVMDAQIRFSDPNQAVIISKMANELFEVDPSTLHLPSSRRDGVDPMKLHRPLAKHGLSVAGMPPLDVKRGTDGELVIFDGVTRATRVAKYLPGIQVVVEVTGLFPSPAGILPTVGERL